MVSPVKQATPHTPLKLGDRVSAASQVSLSSAAEDAPARMEPVDVAIRCMKCDEPVSMEQSKAAGSSNLLRRKCLPCNAIQAALTRNKTVQGQAALTALKRKSCSEQQEWFRAQKRKREAVDSRTRYNFSDLKGEQRQDEVRGHAENDQIHWQPFSVWALEYKIMHQDASEEDMMSIFENKLMEAGAKVKSVGGELCLGKFIGQIESVSRGSELRTGVVRSRTIEDVQGIEDFERNNKKVLDQRESESRRSYMASAAEETPAVPHHEVLNLIDSAPAGAGFRNVVGRDLLRQAMETQREARELSDSLMVAAGEKVADKPKKKKEPALWTLKLGCKNTVASKLGQVKGRLSDFERDAKSALAEVEQLSERIDDKAVRDDVDKDLNEAKSEYSTAVGVFKAALLATEKRWGEIQVDSLTSVEELQKVDKQVRKESIDDFKEIVKPLRAAITKLKRMKTSLSVMVDQLDAAKIDVGATSTVSGACASLFNVLTRAPKESFEKCGLGTTFNDFLLNRKPVVMSGESFVEVASDIAQNRYYNKQLKWLGKHIDKTESAHAFGGVMDAKVCKQFVSRLTSALGDHRELFASKQLPEGHEIKGIYDLQTYAYNGDRIDFAPTAFCCAEGHVCLSGQELTLGLRISDLAGATLRDKMGPIYSMSLAEVTSVARRAGFLHTTTDSSPELLLIPSGFVVLSVNLGSASSHGIRWSISGGTADDRIVVDALALLLGSYPELSASPYGAFKRFLDAAPVVAE